MQSLCIIIRPLHHLNVSTRAYFGFSVYKLSNSGPKDKYVCLFVCSYAEHNTNRQKTSSLAAVVGLCIVRKSSNQTAPRRTKRPAHRTLHARGSTSIQEAATSVNQQVKVRCHRHLSACARTLRLKHAVCPCPYSTLLMLPVLLCCITTQKDSLAATDSAGAAPLLAAQQGALLPVLSNRE